MKIIFVVGCSLGILTIFVVGEEHQQRRKIKDYRNELAHGDKSFTAIGRNVTYNGDGEDGTRGLGLIHFKNYTIEHLSSFIDNIVVFMQNENYLFANGV